MHACLKIFLTTYIVTNFEAMIQRWGELVVSYNTNCIFSIFYVNAIDLECNCNNNNKNLQTNGLWDVNGIPTNVYHFGKCQNYGHLIVWLIDIVFLSFATTPAQYGHFEPLRRYLSKNKNN